MTSRETLARLRDVLARELETISLYEAHADAETEPQMKALFQHLADEEKEHVTEVYEALLVHDAAQRTWAETGAHAIAIREQRFGADVAAAPATLTASPAAPPSAPTAAVSAASPSVGRDEAKASGIRPTRPTIGSLLGVTQD